jgi:uncharacterized repeat protein (TIGR03847 family)
MSDRELSPEVFTADYAGEPGQRQFFVQASGDFGTLTYMAEKTQVQVLAEKLRDLLLMVDRDDTIVSTSMQRDPAMGLQIPIEAAGAIGPIALAYEEEADNVVVIMQEADDEDEEPIVPEAIAGLRLRLRRDQVRAFVLHALAVVEEGRPICPLCNLPMNPEGHDCPAGNGHHPI